ncbi:MAG: AmmeMemoRadiSam system protein A [Nitrospiraceae bacterium]|nr:AmmeMemoRadiSam system protein A [Nitrospiraceae bacterium]
MHSLVKLAKEAIEAYIKEGRAISPPSELTLEMKEQAGVFVCIKKHGELRGCIGTFIPSCQNVALEIIKNAICAATQDPRFNSVKKDELDELTYSIDVLTPPEEVIDVNKLDTKKYGVIISKGYKKGLLLPDLEGVDTVDEQLRIAKIKGGISPDDKDIKIFRFEVRRHN